MWKLTATQRDLAIDLYKQKKLTVILICQSLGISKPTLYAYVRSHEGQDKGRGRQRRPCRSRLVDGCCQKPVGLTANATSSEPL